MVKKIYSFDIFDTCLVRKCGRQDLFFELLGKAALGDNSDNSRIYDFVLIRKKAEILAREKSIKEDVLLEDIYNNMDITPVALVNKNDILKKELELHEEMLLPVKKILDIIEELHANGFRIVFISDMYLPSDFLKSILYKNGFFHENDYIFVSGEIGKTKQSGNLYEEVRKQLGVSFSNWVHFGDNQYSDYIVPRRKGICAKLTDTNFSYYEKKLTEKDVSGSDMDVLKLASCARSIRLYLSDNENNRFAADFVAPIYVPFVYSVLLDATKRNIKKIYFLARDGYVLHEIAKVFSAVFPNIQIFYLRVSRKSLYLPGLKDLTAESLEEAFPALSSEPIELLSMLHIPKDIIDLSEFAGLSKNEIVSKLLSNKLFFDEVSKKYNEQCQLCYEYLKRMGVGEGDCAIVDVFGTRKCQKALNTILLRNGLKEVFGYYFGVMWGRIVNQSCYWSLFYGDRMRYGTNDTYYTQKQAIFEQFFSVTDQDRTIGYQRVKDRIVPVFEEDKEDHYKKEVSAVHIEICKLFAKCYLELNINNSTLCCQTAQSVFNFFFHVPRKDYLYALRDFSVVNEGKTEKLLMSHSLCNLILRKSKATCWFAGNLVYNSGVLYKIVIIFLSLLWRRRSKKIVSQYS